MVWGTQPQNFFTILKETIDLILACFEGLKIERDVPCICHWQREVDEPCRRFYRYEDLERLMKAGRHTVDCFDTLLEVSVPTLLYGIHPITEPQVIADIREMKAELKEGQRQLLEGQQTMRERLQQQSELIARNFTRQWNLEMKKIEAECPNTFILMPGDSSAFDPKDWVSRKYQLYLVCQHPTGSHMVGKGYLVRQAEKWWATVSPWFETLLKFLKYTTPVGEKVGLADESLDRLKKGVGLLAQINDHLPALKAVDSLKHVADQPHLGEDLEVIGSALRALHHFLKEADPNQIWGDLHKTITPDGNILWLCDEHRQPYVVEPLVL